MPNPCNDKSRIISPLLASITEFTLIFFPIGQVDAVISTAGVAGFAALKDLGDSDFELALNNKLMGQVNLVRLGTAHVSAGGSITLTSGMLAHNPMPGSSVISMSNGGLESFVKAAALELGAEVRINAVSPVFVKETMEMMGMDSAQGLSAVDTAKAYVAAIETDQSGQVLDVTDYQ
ncbi:MAG: short chain dehydrogenase [Gammaproteobacteria bacterium]|nr:short chain dehydrogenase [Gammaproteobacteria bacterium]